MADGEVDPQKKPGEERGANINVQECPFRIFRIFFSFLSVCLQARVS